MACLGSLRSQRTPDTEAATLQREKAGEKAGKGQTDARGPFEYTGLGKRVVPRLHDLAPHIQRESGGGIHAT